MINACVTTRGFKCTGGTDVSAAQRLTFLRVARQGRRVAPGPTPPLIFVTCGTIFQKNNCLADVKNRRAVSAQGVLDNK